MCHGIALPNVVLRTVPRCSGASGSGCVFVIPFPMTRAAAVRRANSVNPLRCASGKHSTCSFRSAHNLVPSSSVKELHPKAPPAPLHPNPLGAAWSSHVCRNADTARPPPDQQLCTTLLQPKATACYRSARHERHGALVPLTCPPPCMGTSRGPPPTGTLVIPARTTCLWPLGSQGIQR